MLLPPPSLGFSNTPFRRVGPLICYIEYPKGEFRSGKTWAGISPADYGYINGYLGADNAEMDCYVGFNPDSRFVYVINQSRVHDLSEFDEHKCMLGFDSQEEALATYFDGHNFSRDIYSGFVKLTMKKFIKWLEHGDHSIPIKS